MKNSKKELSILLSKIEEAKKCPLCEDDRGFKTYNGDGDDRFSISYLWGTKITRKQWPYFVKSIICQNCDAKFTVQYDDQEEHEKKMEDGWRYNHETDHIKQNKFVNYFKNITIETAKLSTCVSKQVGGLLVRNKRILAIGFNGSTSGAIHCKDLFPKNFNREEHHAWSILNEIHCEQNIIAFCAKNNISTDDTSLFVSLSPCIHCAKLIVASGITSVFFIERYDKDVDGIKFLKNSGVTVIQI